MSRRSTQRSRRSQYLRKSQRKGKSLRHQKRSVQYPLLRRSLRHRRYSGGDEESSGGDSGGQNFNQLYNKLYKDIEIYGNYSSSKERVNQTLLELAELDNQTFKNILKKLLEIYYNLSPGRLQQIEEQLNDIEEIIKNIFLFCFSKLEVENLYNHVERYFSNIYKSCSKNRIKETFQDLDDDDDNNLNNLKSVLFKLLCYYYNIDPKDHNKSDNENFIKDISDIMLKIIRIIMTMMFETDKTSEPSSYHYYLLYFAPLIKDAKTITYNPDWRSKNLSLSTSKSISRESPPPPPPPPPTRGRTDTVAT